MADLCQGADIIPAEMRYQVATACVQSTANTQLAAIREGIADAEATTAIDEIQTTSRIRITVMEAEASADYQSAVQTADTSYSAAIVSASWQAYEIAQGQFYHADVIANEAAYGVLATSQIARAQSLQSGSSASIAAALTAGLASIQVDQATRDAAVDVDRITRIASTQSAYYTSEASKGSSGGLAVAQVQASQIASESGIEAAATSAIASYQANESTQTASIRAKEVAEVTAAQVDSLTQDAYWGAQAITRGAQERQRGDLGDVAQRIAEITGEAGLRANATIQVATTEAANDLYRAQQGAAGARYKVGDELAATQYDADQGKALVMYRADRQSDQQHRNADTDRDLQILGADTDATTRTGVASTQKAEEQYRADQSYAENQVREDNRTAILAAQLARLQQRWDELYPLFVETQAQAVRTPGFLPLPSISRRGVYTPAQVRIMQNQAIASADMRAAGKIRDARYTCTGKGRSVNSGQLEADRLMIATEQAKASGSAVAAVALDAAAKNAEAVLGGQRQNASVFLDQQNAVLEAEAHNIRRTVTFLDSLASLAAGAA